MKNQAHKTIIFLVPLIAFVMVVVILFLGSSYTAQGQHKEIGDFHYGSRQDAFDDSDRSHLITIDEDNNGALAWKCFSDGLNVVLSLGTYMIGDEDDDIKVRYRFDDNQASDFEWWGLSTTNKAAFIRMSKITSFTRDALTANKIVMEAVDPRDFDSKRYSFGLSGLAEGLDLLSCATAF